jgi:hypothetical protein
MNTLADAVDDYVTMRQGLGYRVALVRADRTQALRCRVTRRCTCPLRWQGSQRAKAVGVPDSRR